MTAYAAMISGPAQEIDPGVTARTYPFIAEDADEEEEPIFVYRNTHSSRVGIEALTDKLRVGPVAIVGLGGTGSYILDLITKAPLTEIHVFDGDRFAQHNAFRAPGAATEEELRSLPPKVGYHQQRYGAMHRRIEAHEFGLDETNVGELEGMVFVFVAVDEPEAKRPIIEFLQTSEIAFVDVGMGIEEVDGALRGLIRTTAASEAKHDHIGERISTEGGGVSDDYDQNIQIAELNALNAALAVIRFKKHLGFYADDVGEHHSVYVLSENALISEERA
jgi:hypothetical protein